MNKLMQRIFTAQDKQEEELLNQFQDDLELADMEGKLEADQYSMSKNDDGSILVHDKVNNEDTKVTINDGAIQMEDSTPVGYDIELGTEVEFVDSSGQTQQGILKSVNDGLATVEVNGVDLAVDYDLLTQTGVSTFSDNESKMIANIKGYDCIFDLNKGSIEIPEEKFKMAFRLNLPFDKVINQLIQQLDKLSEKNNSKRTFSKKKVSRTFSQK